MESVIVVIILAVVSALLDRNKKTKRKNTKNNAEQLGENWAKEMMAKPSGKVKQSKPKKQQYAGLDEYRKKLEQQQKTAKPKPVQQTAQKPAAVSVAKKKMQPELCEAHPERTPNANLKGETMIEHELAAKKQSGKHVKPVTVVIKSEAPMTSPVTLQPRESLAQGIDIAAFLQQKQYSPIQQGILWSEILGEPVAKRRRNFHQRR